MTLQRLAAGLNLQANAENLMSLTKGDRKRMAFRALQEQDEEALWTLVLGWLVLYGRSGSRISKHTTRKYRAAIKAYWQWALARAIAVQNPPDEAGVAYIRALEANGFKRNTIGWNLAGCRALYGTLRWCGIDADPFRDVKARRDPVPAHKKGKHYTAEQIEKLLAVADEQQTLILLLGADCGLRVGEMVNLTRSGIHLEEDPPVLRFVGKGNKVREVTLSRRAEAAIRRWLWMTPTFKGTYLLTWRSINSVELQLKSLCELADVPYEKRSVHGLRRTAGSRMYKQTHDLLETKEFLGHSSATTTEVYVKYAEGERTPKNRDW